MIDPILQNYLFQLLHEVVPILIAYALVGAFSAVVELASVAAAAAYCAQITRRRLREKQQSWVSRNQLEIQVQLQKSFFFLGSSGISSCVRTAGTVMCLHTWHSPAM